LIFGDEMGFMLAIKKAFKGIKYLYTDKNWNVIDNIFLMLIIFFTILSKTTADSESLFLLNTLIFMFILISMLIRHLMFRKTYEMFNRFKFASAFMKSMLIITVLMSIFVVIELICIIVAINV
jgi:uncharacterized membrane protein YjgN (DUF898 family)